MKKHIVFLTGAGMSAESGISTFRDSDGLWAKYRVEDVCTTGAWARNPELVLNFYNDRRREYMHCQPNEGHRLVADLEKDFQVDVVTQNIDNLHEEAGSTHVLHLHGEMMKCRPENNETTTYDIDPLHPDIHLGDKDSYGVQLRPFIVFFGEGVPNYEKAVDWVKSADVLVIIGTSLNVYPAAGLVAYAKRGIPIYLIDPKEVNNPYQSNFMHICKGASEGMKDLVALLRKSE